jgi:hypothetical protein
MNDDRNFTGRVSDDEYEALRTYAFYARRSMASVLTEALQEFLSEEGRLEDLGRHATDARRRFRAVFDRLSGEPP